MEEWMVAIKNFVQEIDFTTKEQEMQNILRNKAKLINSNNVKFVGKNFKFADRDLELDVTKYSIAITYTDKDLTFQKKAGFKYDNNTGLSSYGYIESGELIEEDITLSTQMDIIDIEHIDYEELLNKLCYCAITGNIEKLGCLSQMI